MIDAAPVQAVQDPSCTLSTAFMIAAHDVQARFVIVVQAIDSYSVPEQAKGSHIGVVLQVLLVLSQ